MCAQQRGPGKHVSHRFRLQGMQREYQCNGGGNLWREVLSGDLEQQNAVRRVKYQVYTVVSESIRSAGKVVPMKREIGQRPGLGQPKQATGKTGAGNVAIVQDRIIVEVEARVEAVRVGNCQQED